MALCDSLEAERQKRESTRDQLTTASLNRLTAADVDVRQFKAHADFAIKVLPKLTTRPDQIKMLRQTILDLAVRGKLVQQDPNDEPAVELLKQAVREKLTRTAEMGNRSQQLKLAIKEEEKEFPLPMVGNGRVWQVLSEFGTGLRSRVATIGPRVFQ